MKEYYVFYSLLVIHVMVSGIKHSQDFMLIWLTKLFVKLNHSVALALVYLNPRSTSVLYSSSSKSI